MIRRYGLLCVFCGTLCLSVARSLAEPDSTPQGKVTADEVLAALAKLDARERTALANDPALLKQVVQLTLAQRLLLHEARSKQWDERPEVKAKLERARDTALAESWLQFATTPPNDYPGEEEINAAYEAQKASLSTPRQYRIAQIFIACPRNAAKSAAQKAEAKRAAVTKKLKAYTQDFATIARADSEEAVSAANGGEIGWLAEAQIQPELRPFITRLLKHEVTEPVRLNDGWHILKCLDKREAGTPSLEDARARLITQLRAEKTKANSEAHVARLLKENPVSVDEEAAARLCAEMATDLKLQSSNSNPQPPGKSAPGKPSD
jgi:parvulin-like peptidyl-prolyl isomerase